MKFTASEGARDRAITKLVRLSVSNRTGLRDSLIPPQSHYLPESITPDDARAIMEEIAELGEALHQALAYVEADELAHGRRFGTGNAIRAALRKEAKTGELLIGEE